MSTEKKKRRSSKSNRAKRARFRPVFDAASSFGRQIGRALGNATERVEKQFKGLAGAVGSTLGLLGSILVPTSLRKKVGGIGRSKKAKQIGSQVGEFTEKVEKKFSTTATNVFEVLGFLSMLLLPRCIRDPVAKFWKRITRRVSRFFKRIGKGLDKWAERYLPSWLVRGIKRTSRLVRRTASNTTRFVGAWWKTRDFKALAWSTPAILMTVPMVGFATLSAVNTNGDKIRHYQRVTFDADQDGRVEAADLYRQKLKQLGYLKMESAEYAAAITSVRKFEEDNKNNKDVDEVARKAVYEAAYARMKKIAPLTALDQDHPPVEVTLDDGSSTANADGEEKEDHGHLFAHLWIVSRLMDGKITEGSEEANWKRIEQHVDVAQRIDPHGISAKYFKIKIDEYAGREVIAPMIELEKEYPQFAAELMLHYQRGGNFAEARKHARKYVRHVSDLPDESLSAGHYISWSHAELLQGDELAAREVAMQGGQRFPDEPILAKVVSAASFSEYHQMDSDDPSRLPTLTDAHSKDRANLAIANELARKLVYDELNTRPVVDRLKSEQRCAPEVFLLAGDIHAGGGRWPKARSMYEEAIAVDPNCSKAHNNIAWVSANIPPVRLRHALEAVTEAIRLDPDATYYETRGQIHVKMQRWKDATEDLERAINGMLPEADLRNAHESLAQAYKKLGQPERAAAHRVQAGRLP